MVGDVSVHANKVVVHVGETWLLMYMLHGVNMLGGANVSCGRNNGQCLRPATVEVANV